jgi:hypothetical protein
MQHEPIMTSRSKRCSPVSHSCGTFSSGGLTPDLFRDWQEITNSIFCGGPSGLRQQMDVWFWIEREPPPRGTNAS